MISIPDDIGPGVPEALPGPNTIETRLLYCCAMRSLQPTFANGATQMLRPAGKSQDFRGRARFDVMGLMRHRNARAPRLMLDYPYHGAITPSAWLTSYRLGGDTRLDRFGIEDGLWRKVTSCRRWSTNGPRLPGMIARTEQQLGEFRADLVHLDATIRLFAPGMEPKRRSRRRGSANLIFGLNGSSLFGRLKSSAFRLSAIAMFAVTRGIPHLLFGIGSSVFPLWDQEDEVAQLVRVLIACSDRTRA